MNATKEEKVTRVLAVIAMILALWKILDLIIFIIDSIRNIHV